MSREYSVLNSVSNDGSEIKNILVENPMESAVSDYFTPKFTANAKVVGIIQVIGDSECLDSIYESC